MSTAETHTVAAVSLVGLGFALLADGIEDDAGEARWLRQWQQRLLASGRSASESWQSWLDNPPPGDGRLHAVARLLQLRPAELLALALAVEVEVDPMAGRALAWLQSPSGTARPTVGLVAMLASRLDGSTLAAAIAVLAGGAAIEAGMLQLDNDSRPLPETGLRVPTPLALALAGAASRWPPIEGAIERPPLMPPSLRQQVSRYAQACQSGQVGVVIRSGHPVEARAAAQALAEALGAEPAFITGDAPAGIGPWLWLMRRLPVICAELAPGEQRVLPRFKGYPGPVLAVTGPDGSFTLDGEPVMNWRLPIPEASERIALWQAAGGDPELAQQLGEGFRHSAGRIQGLTRAGRFQAALAGEERMSVEHVAQAGRQGAAADLGGVAELMPEAIDDAALVLPTPLRGELEFLLQRCIGRDGLVQQLGEASRARHRPGVRALLYGPSGTGKTLAVGWLATRLGLPLYRVDLASVTSKYIGETEKNLAQLFARAEHAEVVLMFDEADALFGKRTDVKDSNDRYANAQTNYLLQRIESYEGIALLTSNSRARFDSAFSRRLDAIIEFPLPAPDERRTLWVAHLGKQHDLSAPELNRLAATCELAGGHIRNVVLAAAAIARNEQRVIGFEDLKAGLIAEYRKLGKQPPSGLVRQI